MSNCRYCGGDVMQRRISGCPSRPLGREGGRSFAQNCETAPQYTSDAFVHPTEPDTVICQGSLLHPVEPRNWWQRLWDGYGHYPNWWIWAWILMAFSIGGILGKIGWP